MTTWKRPFQPTHRKPRDRFRDSQIAPVHPIEPVVCKCSHARLMHEVKCLSRACGCLEYREKE